MAQNKPSGYVPPIEFEMVHAKECDVDFALGVVNWVRSNFLLIIDAN